MILSFSGHLRASLSFQLPFSEFFLTNRGYMQDAQTLLPRASVNTVGLLLADKVTGPFELELQAVKVVRRLTTRTEQ